MSVQVVHCVVKDPEAPEDDAHCSFLVPQPVNLSKVKELFPYKGTFHFRLKTIHNNSGYVWRDIASDHEDLHASHHLDSITLQALLLDDFDDCTTMTSDDEDNIEDEGAVFFASYGEYLGHVDSHLHHRGGIAARAKRFPADAHHKQSHSTGGTTSLLNKIKSAGATLTKAQNVAEMTDAVKTGAMGLWNSFRQSATTFINQQISASVLSDLAEEHLAELSEDLAAVYTDQVPTHAAILENVWGVLFPEQPFQRNSAVWKEAGWQKPDPAADLKTTGILALKALVFLGQTYPHRMAHMLAQNKENVKSKYPFAVVAVNITLLLSELLNIRDQKYLSATANYWAMFEQNDTFFEVFSVCFFHIDNTWTQRSAVRTQFGMIIGECKDLVAQVLTKAPQSILHFKQLASETGMLIH